LEELRRPEVHLLNLFDPFIESSLWLAMVVIGVLGIWLFGKRIPVLKSVARNHPIVSAVIDLIAALLMILNLGSFVRSILARYGAVDVSDQILDFILLTLLLATARCFARFSELYFLSNHRDDDLSYLPGLQRNLLIGGFLFVGFGSFIYIQGYSITGLYISTGAVAALVALRCSKP
jgi:hypothetical protein